MIGGNVRRLRTHQLASNLLRFMTECRKSTLTPILICVCFFLTIGCGKDPNDAKPMAKPSPGQANRQPERTDDPLANAQHLLRSGQLDAAFESAQQALLEDPDRVDAKLVLSQIEAARGNHQAAIDLVRSIDKRSELGLQAIQIHFEQLAKLGKNSAAADVILEALAMMPDQEVRALGWRRRAWSLLNRVGRRQEASLQAHILARHGNATQAEITSLARRNDAFPYELETGKKPQDYFDPGLGMAKWYWNEKKYRLAIKELSHENQDGFESTASCVFYGRLLAETQAMEQIPAWHDRCENDAADFSDYWLTLGSYFYHQRQFEASARAFLESAKRDPSNQACANQLAKVFGAMEQADTAEQFRHRAALMFQLESVVALAPEPEMIAQLGPNDALTQLLLQLGRPFEAIGWTLLSIPRNDAQTRAAVQQQLALLNQNREATKIASELALVGVDPKQYSMELALRQLSLATMTDSNVTDMTAQAERIAVPQFSNEASRMGLDFQWFQGVQNKQALIPLHELMGGGIAIIDWDLDGWPDVYLAQGAGDPPTDKCQRSNQLFRNVESKYQAVTSLAGADDFNYSSGLAAGDVNQDGFPDLFLGALGHNRLLINNGDGTFSDATGQLGNIADRFTSSVAIADLNDDQIPDLFEAVYVEMEGGFTLPEIGDDGVPLQPAPIMHYAQSDRWYENLGQNRLRCHDIDRKTADPGTSLGVAITDFDHDGRNEIFVGNDARTNHLLEQTGSNHFTNTAAMRGVACGFSGQAEACMGIATGDFNRDGLVDLHISNYADESANQFIQSGEFLFTDMANRYEIDTPTTPYIGFGAKAVDVDRNGWIDVMVTNGHVFDLRIDGDAFYMPPQFLENKGNRFEPATVEDPSGYWKGKYLGRTIAMTDFDRDGAIDFFVGHLHHPLALLHNQTQSPGDWIQFELIGSTSERDAIGARVSVTMESGLKLTQWVTAGDGYLCSDESFLDFGLGRNAVIEKVQVTWPHGKSQTFANVKKRSRYLIIEGQSSVFRR